jgi:anthrone oxygenase-like protein
MDVVLQYLSLFLGGLLAGEELVVRYGVHPSLAVLDDRAQIQARQGLIRRLRVLVPAIMVPAVLSGAAVVFLDGSGAVSGFRWAGAASLLAFVLVTFLGTVPINIAIGDWRADAPPAEWRSTIRRWGRLDVVRSSMAILAFAFFLTAVTVNISTGN